MTELEKKLLIKLARMIFSYLYNREYSKNETEYLLILIDEVEHERK